MILQALKEYYDRKSADSECEIAPEGFERKSIPFLIVINKDGKFINFEDTREKIGKRLVAKTFLLPRSVPRSGSLSYMKTFLLWDHIGYVLRYPDDEKAKNQYTTWLQSLKELPSELSGDEDISAIIKFYDSNGIDEVKSHPKWNECTKILSCNMTFKIAGEELPIPCCKAVQDYILNTSKSASVETENKSENIISGRCMITGKVEEIVRVHSDTRISKDAKKLVGFQKNYGFDSYGKEQGYNAPIGKTSEFAYTTALNNLLNSSSRMLFGDAVTVCWSKKNCDLENQIKDIFGEPQNDEPDNGVEAVKSLFKSLENGAFLAQADNMFYVLGLAPNSARISVRFWIIDTVFGMAVKIGKHFEDTRIVHGPKDRDVLSLFRLLVSTAAQGKSENIPPNLAGETMRAILHGLPYPYTLLQASIRRIRAEQAKKDRHGKPVPNVTYPRAALIKACINRSTRFKNPYIKEELHMSLDENNTNIGYRLGRLFATLEKIQMEANPGINTTIRDRFYGAASGTPSTVFGNLMRLKNHHLAKLENKGRKIFFEKLLSQIIDGVEADISFPTHLSLEDQGRFAIGYYHQVQKFFTKNT